MSAVASTNPKTTLTAFATGLESLSALIQNETVRKICIIASPGVALTLIYFYSITSELINTKKGIKEYKVIISEFEIELNSPNTKPVRKKALQLEIDMCKLRINELRTKNIRIK